MGRLSFAPAALRDLEEIGDYIAKDSRSAARRFLAALRARCGSILDSPRGGRLRPELLIGVRSFPFQRYVIFYTTKGDDVRIERILHGSRDIEAIFNPDEEI